MTHHTAQPTGDGARDGRGDRTIAPRSGEVLGLFNAFELRLFRYTTVLLCLVTIAVLTVIIARSLGWLLDTFYNLLLSLAVAGVLSLVLQPVAEFLEVRFRLPHLLAVSLLITAFVLGIAAILALLVPLVLSQTVQLMTVVPELLLSAQEHLEFYYPEVSAMVFGNQEDGGGKKALPNLEETGSTVMSYLGLLSGISLVPLLLFFSLMSRGALRIHASEVLTVFKAGTRRKTLYFFDVFIEYVTTFFQGQLIIAASMAILYAASFTLIGLRYGVVIGLILGLLNIVPFLGSLIGLLVVLPMAYLQPSGGAELLALTALVFAAVQLVESWVLTPRIMANRSGLHPALVIISLFFWGTALDGVIGMVLAVPLTAFIVAIWSEIKGSLRHTLSNEDATT